MGMFQPKDDRGYFMLPQAPEGAGMKTFPLLLMLAGLHAGQAEAAPKPLKADYVIYSGDLGEQMPPTKSDRKLSINVTGQSAKAIFDAIGPDTEASCMTGRGERERRKGTVWCFYQPGSGYECYFGFDLRTGKSIEGGEDIYRQRNPIKPTHHLGAR
ncbi:MAG: hypothetical protein EOO81_04405 [Oxalobacteraceae bacterium]|nr:MAG: hypothetical protein EOO81_04405 [Oxalobacteraceae bacterium]